ncbi:hypothetical protein HOP50_01g04670 [Chloropicon primus]|uniref:Uncharacterized protein n=1 Tax=Chloropicon primus TaxID=1764295 RepID=A0A5B8MCR8_9CHLO|nr:hypothetical protein A3770_01p04790 [Chloropicon primus]UPQ97176.1 hypothetical protein HOP50_01g04670 [Chloropicon primus]|eukprot:QDZ17961.1 hypothetical protein A3770_01p04790 [Chloropicon primus]
MEDAGSNLTKIMENRKKQRRNSIANLKKIIKEVRDEVDEPTSKAKRRSSESAATALRLKTSEPEESGDLGEQSILDMYAMTPRRESAVSSWTAKEESAPTRRSVSFSFPPSDEPRKEERPAAPKQGATMSTKPRPIIKESEERPGAPKQGVAMSTEPRPVIKESEERPAAPKEEATTSTTKPSPIKENDDQTTILKKYARKSSKVFELGKQVNQLQQELKKEKEKSVRMEDNYNALFAQKADTGNAASSSADQAQISDLTRRLSLAEQEIVSAKTEYTKLHGLYSRNLAEQRRKDEEDPSSSDRTDLRTTLELAREDIARLQSELTMRSSELGNAREELTILREFRESVHMDQSEKSRLRGMIQKNASDAMEKDAQMSFLEGQLAASRKENKKLREDYEKVVKNEVHKQMTIEELQREKGMLTTQVEQYKGNEEMEKQLKKELQNLAVDLSAKHEQNKQMLQQITEKEEIFRGKQEANGSLEREIALARNALKQSELEKNKALQKMKVHQQEVLMLREEVSQMEKAKKQLGQLSKAFENLPAFSTLAKKHRANRRPPATEAQIDQRFYGGAAKNLNTVFGSEGTAHTPPFLSPGMTGSAAYHHPGFANYSDTGQAFHPHP